MRPLLKPILAVERLGTIEEYIGLKLIAHGPPDTFVGECCAILDENQRSIMTAEVVGFSGSKVYLMPYSNLPIKLGSQVRALGYPCSIEASFSLLGQVVDACAKPLKPGIYPRNTQLCPTQNHTINPLDRKPVHEQVMTGIHAIDALLPIGRGQRIGIFAGSGVGKTSLIGQIAKNSDSEINIIALIGERGREVQDFMHHHLSEKSIQKSIIIAACSDESPVMRRQAAYTATSLAEYFSNQGKEVLLIMDSITRFAMAQREIGLSLGEPPTTKGYTPSVFALLPGLVERTGNFKNKGSITSIYSVLVEGDDLDEPIADHMRALLDGHIVLKRELAERNHYPAISILQSISRLASQLVEIKHLTMIKEIISSLSLYEQHKDLISLGAYKTGSNPALDKALKRLELLNKILVQKPNETLLKQDLLKKLEEIVQ